MIVIESSAFEKLKEIAQAAYPNECCGILLGKREDSRRIAARVLPVGNEAQNQRVRFQIAAQDILKAEEEAAALDLEIVGFFHSHPDCKANASREDGRYALPGFSYPILSVVGGKFAEMNSFTKEGLRDELLWEETEIKERTSMAITVQISATLRTFVERNSKIELEGETVADITRQLESKFPQVKEALYDEEQKLRPFVNLYLNGRKITLPDDSQTALRDGDVLLFLPVIAGGIDTDSVISDERRKEVQLDDKEIDRYGKHLLLREISVKGQKRIKAAKVLIAGLGALGSAVTQYLAAAGVGTLGLVDFDEVSLANLQSQVVHGTRDLHRPKVASAKDFVRAINPLVKVETYNVRLNADNVEEIVSDYDVVVDATDNYVARYLINDICALLGIPVVFGAVYQYEGRVTVFDAKRGPCLRCQFPSPPPAGLVPTCAEGGVISPLPGVIGSWQANEALKLIIGGGDSLIGTMLVFDTWNNEVSKIHVPKDDHCPLCGKDPTIVDVAEIDYEDFCGLKEDTEIPVEGITPEELAQRLDRGEQLTIVDVREPHERTALRFPGAIVIPIGQLARRQKELNPEIDTIFICREGKRSILAINTLREAGYKGPMYNLKGGIEAAKDLVFAHEGGWL